MVVLPKKNYAPVIQRISRAIKFLLIIIPALFVTSCFPILTSDTELTLKKGEKWELTNQIVVTRESANLYRSEIAQTLNETVDELIAREVDSEWERLPADDDGNISYKLTSEGTGYDSFNQAFGLNALTADPTEKKQALFYLKSGRETSFDALHSRFTLKGGKIITSNGIQIDKGTVQWVDHYGPMEATLTPSSGNTGLFLVIILLILGAIGIYYSSRPANPFRGKMMTEVAESFHIVESNDQLNNQVMRFCPHCGGSLPPVADFCPQCGRRFSQ